MAIVWIVPNALPAAVPDADEHSKDSPTCNARATLAFCLRMTQVARANSSNADGSAQVVGLLVQAARGDERAWRDLVNLYARRIFALARSRVRGDELAEEITQSVFATVASKLGHGEYAEEGKFEAWLFRVAMNRIRDEARRARRQARTSQSDAFDSIIADAPQPDDASPEIVRLRLAMSELSDTDRDIIELRHHGGLSFKQLAEMLNEPVGTLLARHHRALKKLKELLESTTAPDESIATKDGRP